ncbi:3-deoxy-D-manno-octulosonic acid kinase [Shewanella inventionis]|uniref:3-deoxy-D-manno-octulosonic acid kinase n=1 Tax=Shewanella inventionis TaxID=1738770 RepID=A0ABQ1J1W3_9GAMM|nr:3-deoxy-D-manno-octulosonic acid kinase [Shewanella inventionis]MCL1157505.1 3-deoxy-D-manno-octulosonic acid kinase [Shewanella inventionis]UAL43568.1 3-deoxy-D-manno-octulosonic acid kinase [Shewanella inventionis]GGB57875.1 3-deoxy-D-manno-octulosonic acid kinase [Shewanella inventionis]
MQIKTTPLGHIAWCEPSAANITPEEFSVDIWQSQNAVVGQSTGRYTTWFVKTDTSQTWVLRHYWRGGLVGKINRDSYFYTGIKQTRAVAELTLLETLHQQGFAVPRPIAANVTRCGLWYRADIIIEHVAGAKDLVAQLSLNPITDQQWYELGQVIAKFHLGGVYHADLNAKNILLAQQTFYLIDFDRGEIRQPDKRWQQANLNRLLRSFNKEHGKQPKLAFSAQCWQQLLDGYRSVNPL